MNAGISLLLYQWQAQQTVSFDMAGTVNRFMSQLASQKLNDERVREMTGRFNASLNASLQDYQTRHRALILVGPAVVSGAEDITAAVQSDVAGRMAQGGQNE
ncbi:conjugal transfer protein TrbI [Leclercia adecarboxylata]|nr:conjugal transfer protein TrbI [Leclercia adecarboxylata]KMN63747.1 conjugal transfer protein TrbI [Leclercia sp. LK8]